MPTINIALLENIFPDINFLDFDITNTFVDPNTLNIITSDNSSNLINPHPHLNAIKSGLNYDPSLNNNPSNLIPSKIRDPNEPLKDKPKTSRGVGGKKPGHPTFDIRSHLYYIEDLRNNNLFNEDLSSYLFNLENALDFNVTNYINNLKNMYEYDIYNNNNDISFILNKYYYKN